jgi:archaemetzincin
MNRLLAASLLLVSACGKRAEPPVPAAAEEGFERQDPPRPGEWLDRFPEAGQTFEQYVEDGANRRTPERGTFAIQPLGDALERYRETMGLMREYAEAFFGVPAKILDPVPMPEEAFNEDRRQHNATTIIRWLARRLPEDALVVIGVTGEDLYSRGLNFVFGEASLQSRTGVYSLKRYQTPDARLFKRRALKLMTHEAGHILSIGHCTFYKCLMQGANHLREDDGHPMHLCPVDLRKLAWNTGVDPRDRYRKLLDFYRRAGLEAEGEWTSRRVPN